MYVKLSLGVHGVVMDLRCEGNVGTVNNTFTANGTDVTFTCTTQTSAIEWVSTNLRIGFTSSDDIGDIEVSGGFTANYTEEGPPATSTLTFTLNSLLPSLILKL